MTLQHLVRELAAQFAGQNEQFAVVANNMANMQKQPLELSNAAALTAEWMRTRDARANSSDKTLDCLRERLAAPQTASVSSVETRSIVSDWPLPKVAGSVGSGSQPPGKRQKPSFSPPQKAYDKSGISKTTSFEEVLFWSIFPSGQSKDRT